MSIFLLLLITSRVSPQPILLKTIRLGQQRTSFQIFHALWFPARILYAQGKEFENKLFYQLQQLSGMIRSRTSSYHPRCNWKAERFNKALPVMLRTLPVEQKSSRGTSTSLSCTCMQLQKERITRTHPIPPFVWAITSFANWYYSWNFARVKWRQDTALMSRKWKSAMSQVYTLSVEKECSLALKVISRSQSPFCKLATRGGCWVLVRNLSGGRVSRA